MTRSRLGLLAAFLAGAIGAAAQALAQPSADQLLVRAKTVRLDAEKSLAAARQRHLDERTALAKELKKAYEALSAARAEEAAAGASLSRAQADSADWSRDAGAASHRSKGLIAQAAAMVGAKVDPAGPIDRIEPAVWGGFGDRLDAVRAQLTVTVQPEAIVARDGQDTRVAVVRLGGYAAYACGESPATCGLLRTAPEGRERIVGAHLAPRLADALRAAAEGNLTRLPIDVDGSLADRAPADPKTLGSWLGAGGLFIYPILVVGAVGFILVLERIGYLWLTKAPPSLAGEAIRLLQQSDVGSARRLLEASRTPSARVLLIGVSTMEGPPDQREAAVESALLAEAPKLERSLSLLAALAGVAPLLGLLGTVSGMISTFNTISATGTGNPRLLSGGISEALITTQLGLMVAIPLLLAHAWLRRWAERREAQLEHDAVRVLGTANGDDGPEHD